MSARAKAIEAALRKCLACMDHEAMDADPPEARTRLHDARDDARAALALPVEPEGEAQTATEISAEIDEDLALADAIEDAARCMDKGLPAIGGSSFIRAAARLIRRLVSGEDKPFPASAYAALSEAEYLREEIARLRAPAITPAIDPATALPVEAREPVAWAVRKNGRLLGTLYGGEAAREHADWLNAGGRVQVAEAVPLFAAPPQPEASEPVAWEVRDDTGHLYGVFHREDVPRESAPAAEASARRTAEAIGGSVHSLYASPPTCELCSRPARVCGEVHPSRRPPQPEARERAAKLRGTQPVEYCVICGQPKSRTNEPGDEARKGWPACVNPDCEAFGEQTASASFDSPFLQAAWSGAPSPEASGETVERYVVVSDDVLVSENTDLRAAMRFFGEEVRDGRRPVLLCRVLLSLPEEGASGESTGPAQRTSYGHDFSRARSPEGYGICACGARENTPESARECPEASGETVEQFASWLDKRCDRAVREDGMGRLSDALCEVRERFRRLRSLPDSEGGEG